MSLSSHYSSSAPFNEINVSVAEEIQIEIDAHSNINTKEEFSSELADIEHKDVAKQSAETCCLTFVAKRW